MLRFSSFTKILLLLVILTDFGIQCRAKIVEGTDAQNMFMAEELAKIAKIEKIEKKLADAKGHLSIRDTAKSWYNPVKKFFQAIKAMWYIRKRDSTKSELQQAKEENETELLFENKDNGLKICQNAFKHEFFSKRGWILVPEDRLTKKKTISNIKVQIRLTGEDEPKRYWRKSKICMAKKIKSDENTPNKPFKVYISAAEGYGWWNNKVFVFTKTPSNEIDDFQRFALFWQRVVRVEAHLS